MKYLFLESKNKSRKVFYVFEIETSLANKLYKKLKMLPILTNCVNEGWVRISDIPENYLNESEIDLFSQIERFKMSGVILMTQYEYDLSKVLKFLGLSKMAKRYFGQYLNNHYNKVLSNVRKA